jgi:hypothetical protein
MKPLQARDLQTVARRISRRCEQENCGGDMGGLVAIDFRSRVIRTDRDLENKVRECLKAFQKTGAYATALNLCRTA